MSTNPTDEIEAALDREHVLCDCDEKAGENGGHWASCALRVRGPRIAAFIAKREAGLRKALAEQMDNTIAHQRRADVALDRNRLAVKQRDELQAKYDEAVNVARMNGTERDALREQLAGARARALLVFVALGGDQGESESLDAAVSRIVAERDALRAEVEKLREVERAARAFVLAHDSIVVRFQDATLAQVYEDRARELDRLLDEEKP